MITVSVKPASTRLLSMALRDTMAMKKRDPAALVNKAAQYVTSFAVASGVNAKIPIADPAKIEATLRRVIHPPTERKSRALGKGKRKKINRASKVQNEWRGTLAAVIIASLVAGRSGKIGRRYQKLAQKLTKGKNDKGATATQFYRLVARFVKLKQASVGLHRAGLLPAIKAFRAQAADSTLRRFRSPPGTATPAERGSAKITAKITDSARAIDQIAPHAFRQAETEVAALFTKWIEEDILKCAKLEGFNK